MKHKETASIPVAKMTNAEENLAINFMREHFVALVLATLLLLGAAPLVLAKGERTDLAQTPSGWRPVPCKEVKVCGNTTTYTNCDWHGIAGSQESAAHQFLAAFGSALSVDESKLRSLEVKSGLTSINSRFEQIYENRRVFGADVKVISDKEGRIREVRNSYFPVKRILGSGVPVVNVEAAESVGRAAIGKPEDKLPELRMPTRSELVWLPVAGTGVVLLVWQLMIHGQNPFLGDYLTLVDANSGILLHQENRLATSN